MWGAINFAGMVATIAIMVRFANRSRPSPIAVGLVLGTASFCVLFAVVTAISYFLHRFFAYPRLRMLIRAELNARGVPVCMPCGYDLRGQLEPRCPECGAPTLSPGQEKS